MPTARSGLAVATGQNAAGVEHIYAIGGHAGLQTLATVEAYNPGNSTWTARAPMPNARTRIAAVTGSDGKIYVFGGQIGNQATAAVERYDPVTNTWTSRASMPTPRYNLAAARGPNGRIYVFGGEKNDQQPYILDVVEEYDPVSDTWSTKTPLPTARAGLAATTGCNGRIYVSGGGNPDNKLYVYDPGNNTWTTKADMPTGLAYHGSATGLNGRIYVMGMAPYTNVTGAAVAQVYNPSTDLWTSIPAMTGGARVEIAAVRRGNRIHVLGGYRKSGGTGTWHDRYGPTTPTMLACLQPTPQPVPVTRPRSQPDPTTSQR